MFAFVYIIFFFLTSQVRLFRRPVCYESMYGYVYYTSQGLNVEKLYLIYLFEFFSHLLTIRLRFGHMYMQINLKPLMKMTKKKMKTIKLWQFALFTPI